ncbi:hydroxymethylbilane synthase [Epilithonimonas arachidiradicis]|uniref:Hydroxymethylbilane synthase n=2 Tax=Epilithonimonas arachidiradicis TaxID=1617282 RepID=A0A420DCC2_9FLAO|nr:hydroxymethylbilane synthase [Epilithonimonas arachidiradicis]RKE89525.1 hydroxymethylbilane synthase [Epilithonimonas arachidiradicis]
MNTIRIGTRNSPLAMWQAHEVESKLNALGFETEIVPILSSGDKNLDQPLYALGITGVFTKDLDIALLNKEIDIAVHSLKDVPTQLPQNIQITAVLERDFPEDVLVRNNDSEPLDLEVLKIATSSLRRRAFWLKEFPETEFTDIRGNVQTRLKKLDDGIANATIFSLAGIKRMNLDVHYEPIPFLLQAPSQGVVAIASLSDNEELNESLKSISHQETEICVTIEREFLKTLEGGCTAPIGAKAEMVNGQIRFLGRLCSLDGKNCIETDEIFDWNDSENFGEKLANKVLENGGKELMEEIKKSL